MAHICPKCGETCHCGGDIHGVISGTCPTIGVACIHCKQEGWEDDTDDDWEDYDDEDIDVNHDSRYL